MEALWQQVVIRASKEIVGIIMSSSNLGALFLQEQMVAIANQMSIPLIEISLVLQKYTKALVAELRKHAQQSNEILPGNILQPLPLEGDIESGDAGIEIDMQKIVSMTDVDRMDIFDTVIRTAINEKETPLFDALLVIREWEKLARTQLVKSTSAGQLFSPLELPEGF